MQLETKGLGLLAGVALLLPFATGFSPRSARAMTDPDSSLMAEDSGFHRAVLGASREVESAALRDAIVRVVESGFHLRIIEIWEASRDLRRTEDGAVELLRADLGRIRGVARAYLKKQYPGMPSSGGRA